jgi:hypothetical protein
MNLQKAAQLGNQNISGYSGEVMQADDAEQIILEFSDPEEEAISFTLPKIPGAMDDSEIIVDEPSEIAVEEPSDVEVAEDDPWNWESKGMSGFLDWLHGMMHSVPQHSGKDTTGLEKAITYFEALDKEITKAMRSDYKNEVDAAQCEKCREEIEGGLERLVDRLEKVKSSKFKRHNKKKKAEDESGVIVKEAGTTKINGISITVPLFISAVARAMINGHVSAGHGLEDLYAHFDKKYKFADRERLELTQLLQDMAFPLRLDRGKIGEEIDYRSSNNVDYAASFLD